MRTEVTVKLIMDSGEVIKRCTANTTANIYDDIVRAIDTAQRSIRLPIAPQSCVAQTFTENEQ